MKKSRFLYLHSEANAGKVAALEALQVAYTGYLQVCTDALLDAHRFGVSLGEMQTFFAPCAAFSSQIVKNVRQRCHRYRLGVGGEQVRHHAPRPHQWPLQGW